MGGFNSFCFVLFLFFCVFMYVKLEFEAFKISAFTTWQCRTIATLTFKMEGDIGVCCTPVLYVTKTGNGNGKRRTGDWERVYSGKPPENSKWRKKRKKREQFGEM